MITEFNQTSISIENSISNTTVSIKKELSQTEIEDINNINNQFGKMGCDSCLHPTCKHSSILNGICECPGANASGQNCEGMLILDVNSKPHWKLSCNQCNTLLRFKSDIHDITPLVREECSNCSTRLTKFEFSKNKTILPNDEIILTGCIMCNDILNGLTEIVLGRSINLTVLRQIRFKRGGGGRGRGRGRRKGDPKMSFSDF
jgi:DNA topoisomerase-3